jgi:hypothetical protein
VDDVTPQEALIPLTERRCGRCHEMRPIEMFYTGTEERRAIKQGRSRFFKPCRLCNREMNDARRKPRQDHADAVKAERGCRDCGLSLPEHPEVFDFDHIDPTTKVSNIAALYTKGTFEEFVAEIAKCEVVCANCHRIRTRSRESNAFGRSRR